MGKKGPLWWKESDWLLRGSSAANQILLRHSGPILSNRNRPNRGPELYNNVEYGNLLIQKRNAFQIKKKHTQPD